jgi:RimJ/RimL family protein N-acetyltransferase
MPPKPPKPLWTSPSAVVGLAEVWSMTAVLNEPSQAVMRRIGLTEVARFDHPRIQLGDPLRPHVTYHLSRPEG